MIALFFLVCPFLFVYALCGFILWELNPGNWTETWRFLCVSIGCCLTVPVMASAVMAGKIK